MTNLKAKWAEDPASSPNDRDTLRTSVNNADNMFLVPLYWAEKQNNHRSKGIIASLKRIVASLALKDTDNIRTGANQHAVSDL